MGETFGLAQSARPESPVPAGMVAADALAIAVGAVLGTRLPERAVRVAVAIGFVAFGLILLIEALGS